MKKVLPFVALISGIGSFSAYSQDLSKPKTAQDSMGTQVADMIPSAGLSPEDLVDRVVAGMRASLSTSLSDEVKEKKMAFFQRHFTVMKREHDNFMAAAATSCNAKVLPSGVIVEILNEGKKDNLAVEGSEVTVNYKLTLPNGKVADSSYDRGEPNVFHLTEGSLIKGFIEGIMQIGEGGHVKIWIPYNMGYGETGAAEIVPPYSPLVFDVELLKVTNSTEEPTNIVE